MAGAEELSDELKESLNLNKTSQADLDDDAVFKEMYYNRFAKKGANEAEANPKSFEEAMQEFSKMPLFMNNLDDAANGGMHTLSHSGIVSACAKMYLQMVKMQNWMLFEHCNTREPKLRLAKASRSKGMRWSRRSDGVTQRSFTRKLSQYSPTSPKTSGKRRGIQKSRRKTRNIWKSNVSPTGRYAIWK